jgi:hypothetical protein
MSSRAMISPPAFRLPDSFSAAVLQVHAATDAAAARADTLPAASGDITVVVDQIARAAYHDLNSRWVHALTTLHNFGRHNVVDDPSALHHAVMTMTHDTVITHAPLALAAIIANVADLQAQTHAWFCCMQQLGMHSHFVASLNLLEASYAVVRSAAVHADVIVQALYTPVCVVIPSHVDFAVCLDEVQAIFHLLEDDWQAIYLSDIKPVIIEGHIEFRNRFPAAQSQHVTTTYVGTVPSRELACHAACSVIIPATFCSNCNVRPVAVHPRCFADWCQRCDYSLWIDRRRTGPRVNSDSGAAVRFPHATRPIDLPVPRDGSEIEFVQHTESQLRGLHHCHRH